MLRRSSILLLWLAYLAFVVYGSLVPLNFTARPPAEAWSLFLQTSFYRLGVESRADWVANGILYIPVGFLTAYAVATIGGAGHRFLAAALAVVLGSGLALAVEFTQLFFPPRTVSLNDLIAEFLGNLFGVVLALRFADWFKRVLAALGSMGKAAPTRLVLEAYVVGYFAFSLFPFDFLLSGAELERKLHSDLWGWGIAGGSQGGVVAALRLFAEVMLTAPLGWFLASRSARPGANLFLAGMVGTLYGAAIELLQLFMASGLSQGASILTRLLGTLFGTLLWRRRSDLHAAALRRGWGRFVAVLAPAYALVLMAANGWTSSVWSGFDVAAAKLGELHFLPFYYHYYTSEAKALYSVAATALMYGPVGVLVWLAGGRRGLAVGLAAGGAAMIEGSKLFLAGLHPDPTNVFIAMVGAWCAFQALGFLLVQASPGPVISSDLDVVAEAPGRQPEIQPDPASPARPRIPRGPAAWGGAAAVAVVALVFLADFPFHPIALGIAVAIAAGVIWRYPVWLFAVVPAMLPVLDLAPWSGRFFLDEYDLLLWVAIAIGYLRLPKAASPGRRRLDWLLGLALGALGCSFLISTLIGLWPLQAIDANSFTNYYSHFNALRVAKGFFWGLLLVPLLLRTRSSRLDMSTMISWGMTIGLALTVAVILWERVAFSGLFNFASDYRVTGPFSAIHVGGAFIECFLATAVPFALLVVLRYRSVLIRASVTLLLVATTYALMVTYSRNGYLAYAVAILVMLAIAATAKQARGRRSILLALLALAMLGTAAPVFLGKFAQDRLALVGRDLGGRWSHWSDSLNTMDQDWGTAILGMGVGRFPEINFWRSRELGHSSIYRLESEGGNRFLRLTSGESIYVEQFVSLLPDTEYLLSVDARANRDNAQLTVPVCEKWMLASYDCAWNTVNLGAGGWTHYEMRFNSKDLGDGPWYSARPVKLGLYNGNPKLTIDVDNVRLAPLGGEDILRNGDFTRNMDAWFFSTDSHLQWHAKSLAVATYFDQGWFGLLAWFSFLALALTRILRQLEFGDLFDSALLAALGGFLVVGVFDTVIDSPRFLFLLVLLAATGAIRGGGAGRLSRRAR